MSCPPLRSWGRPWGGLPPPIPEVRRSSWPASVFRRPSASFLPPRPPVSRPLRVSVGVRASRRPTRRLVDAIFPLLPDLIPALPCGPPTTPFGACCAFHRVLFTVSTVFFVRPFISAFFPSFPFLFLLPPSLLSSSLTCYISTKLLFIIFLSLSSLGLPHVLRFSRLFVSF